MGLGADRAIRERQRHEAQHEALVASNLDQTKVEAKAQWENKCGTLQRSKAIRRKVTDVMQARSDSLMDRRRKLGTLLAMEQSQYEKEIVETAETGQERLQKTANKAMELKKKREAERQRVVQEKMYQQWREGVDELRKADSQLFRMEVLAARDDQVYEKSLRGDVEQAEADHYNKLWQQSYDAKLEREIKEDELRRKRNEEMGVVLKFQVDMKEEARREERSKLMVEEDEMKKLWKEQRIEAEEEVLRNAVMAKLERKKVDEFAAIQKQIREADIEKEKKIDKDFVMQAMKESKEACEADAKEKLRLKEESYEFAQKMKLEFAARAVQEEEAEEKLKSENEKQWRKRQDQWDIEAAARQKLMEETYEDRARQVELQENERQRRKDLIQQERVRIDAEVERLEKMENERLDAEEVVKHRHQEELFRQMDFHQIQRMREMQQVKIEQRDGAIQEQKFQRALNVEKQKLVTLKDDITQTKIRRDKERAEATAKLQAEKNQQLVAPWEK